MNGAYLIKEYIESAGQGPASKSAEGSALGFKQRHETSRPNGAEERMQVGWESIPHVTFIPFAFVSLDWRNPV